MKLSAKDQEFVAQEVNAMRELIAGKFGGHVAEVFAIGFSSLINKDKMFYAERIQEQRVQLFDEGHADLYKRLNINPEVL